MQTDWDGGVHRNTAISGGIFVVVFSSIKFIGESAKKNKQKNPPEKSNLSHFCYLWVLFISGCMEMYLFWNRDGALSIVKRYSEVNMQVSSWYTGPIDISAFASGCKTDIIRSFSPSPGQVNTKPKAKDIVKMLLKLVRQWNMPWSWCYMMLPLDKFINSCQSIKKGNYIDHTLALWLITVVQGHLCALQPIKIQTIMWFIYFFNFFCSIKQVAQSPSTQQQLRETYSTANAYK